MVDKGAPPFVTTMPYTTRYQFNDIVGNYYDYDQVKTTSTIFWGEGRAYYPAWSIEWIAEDNVTPNPPWPTLTSDMVIPTWVPGENITDDHGQYDNKGKGKSRTTPLPKSKFDRVGVPVISALVALLGLVLFLAVLLFWCLRRRRSKKTLVKAPSEEIELEMRN